MNLFHFHLSFFSVFILLTLESNAQQRYSGNLVMDCNNTDAFLYTCNSIKPSCPAFLFFRTQPLYNTVAVVSKLLSSDPTEVSRINKIPDHTKILPINKELIIPVNCSCSGQYYQANTSFVIPTIYDTYFSIANYTYEGLTTCASLMRENPFDQYDLHPGSNLQVPLRCACPTVEQEESKFLMTYLVTWKDSIPTISKRFNVRKESVALANGFSSAEEAELYPFTTLLVPLSTEPISLGYRKRLWKRGIIAGVGVGSFSAVVCFSLFLGCFLWKRNRAERGGKEKWVLPKHIRVGIAKVDQVLQIYEFEELEKATDGFSLGNRLTASIYKGRLRGKDVAIKQMTTDASKEVKILQKINHFNLICLYGACEHDGACYLVYEFMEMGCLKEWLQDKTSPESQNWNHRIRIALDVAKGLQYLHNFASPAYVHKYINSSNILLTKDLRAKISKFGLARSAETDENGNSSIKCPFESKGYLAPEYLEDGLVTTNTDVYAFGVVLLELITGREAVYKKDDDDEGKEVMLSEEVLSSMGDERHAKDELNRFIDPRLLAKHPLGFILDQNELALCLVNLSIACLETEPSKRLSMNKVVSTLMRIQMDIQSSGNMFIA